MKNYYKSILLIVGFSLFLSCKKNLSIKTANNTVNQSSSIISKEIASKVALNFSASSVAFSKKNISRGARAAVPLSEFENKEIQEIITVPDDNGETSLYIVKFKPSGYVIVSGTTKESPVLGYSEDGVFDINLLPPNLAVWLMDRADKIKILKSVDELQVPVEIKKEWTQLAPSVDKEIIVGGGTTYEQQGPFLQTEWGQDNEYNTLLNPINGLLPPTGCVATAMAQIMRYHEYPKKYQWSNMPNLKGSIETSQLMKDVGSAVHMNYSLTGSGAYLTDARTALINTFGYSSSIQYINFDLISVITELNNNRPVILDAFNTRNTTTSGWWIFKSITTSYDVGHAWVCDGYKRDLVHTIHNPGTRYEYIDTTTSGYYLHMNWGWGIGSPNGWFKFDSWAPTTYNFQFLQKCMIGIKY